HLRLLLDEYRRHQHARLPEADRRGEGRGAYLPAAAHAGDQGSGSRPRGTLCAIRLDQALAAGRNGGARSRAPAIGSRARQARRLVGMHPLLLLLDQLPELLVERRPLSRAGDPAAGLSLAGRQSRRAYRRATRRARGPVPALSLPHHHELHQDLPEEPESGQGDRRDQEDAGRAALAPLPDPRPGRRPAWAEPKNPSFRNGLGLTGRSDAGRLAGMTKSELILRLAELNPHLYQRD